MFEIGEITEDESIQIAILEHLSDHHYRSIPEELEDYEDFIEDIIGLLEHIDEYEWIAY